MIKKLWSTMHAVAHAPLSMGRKLWTKGGPHYRPNEMRMQITGPRSNKWIGLAFFVNFSFLLFPCFFLCCHWNGSRRIVNIETFTSNANGTLFTALCFYFSAFSRSISIFTAVDTGIRRRFKRIFIRGNKNKKKGRRPENNQATE